MNRLTGWIVAVVAASLVLAGCSGQQDAEDEMPDEEPTVEEDVESGEDDVAFEEEGMPEDEEEEGDEGVLGLVGVAEMQDAEGNEIGEVIFTQLEEGVRVEGTLEGLEEGPRGFHVHENSVCEAPDFESAGGHFNPEGHEHGGPDAEPGERHAGDFGNIEFDEDGVAEFSFVDEVITLGDGVNDVGGHALILHFEEDDQESQPTGDAGPRKACGIIEVVRDGELD